MARGALVAAGALLVIGGGAAVGYGVTRKATGGMTPQASEAMTTAVGQLDGDVKAARATVHERASTLSALQPVQAAIETDLETAKDMLGRGELAFHPQQGEVIELGQVEKGKDPVTLLVEPEGSMMDGPHSAEAAAGHVAAVRRGKPGSYVELMGNHLVITEVAAVMPKDQTARDLSGYVMVSRPLDLEPAVTRLVSATLSGRLDIGGVTLPFGTATGTAVETKELPLPSQPEVKLVVAVPAKAGGMPVPIVGAGAGSAAIGLILLVVGIVGGKRAAVATIEQPIGTAETRFSTQQNAVTGSGSLARAAGTPAPLDTAGMSMASANLGAGAMIGRWEIIKRLGSGGMADVYLAHSRGEAGFEKLVAIKVMHPHLARNDRAVEHFLDEARLAALIAHPNVVAIQDLGKIGNDYVIVMDYVDGVDLERLLTSARAAQRAVPIDVGLGILCRICDGLNAAHTAMAPDGTRLNIVHRDVKSANVLISKQGGVKVVDFGIAKAATQIHNTVAGETKGTPSMMAPEQRVGEQVDVRADVYSVAAVGYEILTGHGVNLDLAALAHLGIENWPHLPPPSSLRPQLPPELDGVLLSAMSFDRQRRPADCAVFEATFETIMKRHGLGATDKDIARWAATELEVLDPSPAGTGSINKRAGLT